MLDREKVIKGLQIERECVSRDCDRNCGNCDLVQERDWLLSVYDGAIALLKELEPKPVKIGKVPVEDKYFSHCPRCGLTLDEFIHKPSELRPKYCPICGQAIKWN